MPVYGGGQSSIGGRAVAAGRASQGGGGARPGGGVKSGGGGNGGGGNGRPSRQASGDLGLMKYVKKAPGLSVFEKASRGLPLDDDELAQLTPEQRAAWEAQRASAVLGVA
jgi:hypothetical protein